MKKFTDICKMTQSEVKLYMTDYLISQKYAPISQDGFLYAKGDVPVLLVAHMDTVHKEKCTEIVELDGKISSPQGIGGDDRCGIFIIMNLVRKHHCSVLLCEDEERGGIGADKFTRTEYINDLDVNYMIEFDRKGNNDAVFYSCANEEFTNFVLDFTGFKKQYGSFSDISKLGPASGLCAVNLSSGYYQPHTVNEYVIHDDMMSTIAAANALITTECEKPFEYQLLIPKQFSFFDDLEEDYLLTPSRKNKEKMMSIAESVRDDEFLLLEATVLGKNMQPEPLYAEGKTKMECWFDLFTSYTSICFDDIIEYKFS